MKLLILFLISFSVMAQTPSERIFDSQMVELKKADSSHCTGLGTHTQGCVKEFDRQMRKAYSKLNREKIHGRVSYGRKSEIEKIKEEKQVAKYTAYLTSAGQTVDPSHDSSQLKSQWREYQCVDENQTYFTEKGYPFNGSETCEELQAALLVHEPPLPQE